MCVGDCIALSKVLENTFFDEVSQLRLDFRCRCGEADVADHFFSRACLPICPHADSKERMGAV